MSEVHMNPLATERISKLIAKFSIPAIISMLVSAIYNITDQIFIGNGVGMYGIAATNMAFPFVTMCTAMGLLMGIGGASNYNLKSGEGQDDEALKYAANSLSMLVVFGVMIMAVAFIFMRPLLFIIGATDNIMPYAVSYTAITAFGFPFAVLTIGGAHLIRADRNPTFSMIVMLTGTILNIILDPILIFGFKMGVQGAAIATITGQIISGILVVIYFTKMSNMKIKASMLVPKAAYVGRIAALGSSSFINQIAGIAVQLVMNNMLRLYGASSEFGADIPLACIGMISKVNMIFMSICIGISQGCQPIFGFNYGAKNYSRVRETYRKAATAATIVGIVSFILFQCFPRQIIGLFGTGTEEYFRFATVCIRCFMLLTFINGIQPMSSGFFTSIGKAKYGVIVSLTRQIVFLIPLACIFPIFFGVMGVMYSAPFADAAAFVITVVLVLKQINDMKRLEGLKK